MSYSIVIRSRPFKKEKNVMGVWEKAKNADRKKNAEMKQTKKYKKSFAWQKYF